MSDTSLNVGILGAGTMGAGIAQVAATSGCEVRILDVDEQIVRSAIESIAKRINRLVEKGRLSEVECNHAMARLRIAHGPEAFAEVDLLIEVIVEDIDIKSAALEKIVPHLRPETIIATNTSSLSITRLGEEIGESRRTVGMHFFNPPPIMRLVEVIAGKRTNAAVVDRVAEIANAWGKMVARANDVPGFIVNHVARPYYLEAFRILENGYATVDQIDDAMKKLGGFRMGPLELTDLIGQDVNTATTRSVWKQLDKPPLLHPSHLQEALVADGRLGRKVGRGVYDYLAEPARPSLEIAQEPLSLDDSTTGVIERFVTAATTIHGSMLEQYIFARILVAVIAQAAFAHERGVAERLDIDTALKYGVNYPLGAFEWLDSIGHGLCAEMLEALNATVDDNRFALPEMFRSRV
jgi:3-hydroxybutyryl-CoA dehydrogenase